MWIFMRMRLIRSCAYCHRDVTTAAVKLLELCITSQKSVTDWMLGRSNCSGWDRDGFALLGKSRPSQHLELTLMLPTITFACLVPSATISSVLSLQKHVFTIYATWFYWLHQLARVRLSAGRHLLQAAMFRCICYQICEYISPCLRDVSGWLLQLYAGWSDEIHRW